MEISGQFPETWWLLSIPSMQMLTFHFMFSGLLCDLVGKKKYVDVFLSSSDPDNVCLTEVTVTHYCLLLCWTLITFCLRSNSLSLTQLFKMTPKHWTLHIFIWLLSLVVTEWVQSLTQVPFIFTYVWQFYLSEHCDLKSKLLEERCLSFSQSWTLHEAPCDS